MVQQVQAHAMSMAVWSVPSPLILGTTTKIKVGVKCAAGCNLAGEEIEIYDHTGTIVATGILGGVPDADKVNLYWTEVELPSPDNKGTYTWEARLPHPGLEIPHVGSSSRFSFRAAMQPKYAVMIEVVNQATKAPVANAHVMLRPYSGYTDDQGVVKLVAADDDYTLYVTRGEYETFQTTITVAGDTTVRAELTPAIFKEDYRGNLVKVEKRR